MNGEEVGSAIALAVSGGVILLAGVLMVWLARRSRLGKLPRNRLAGVRTALTLSSDEAWFPAQAAAARGTTIGGWGAIVAGAVVSTLGFWGLGPDATLLAGAVVSLGGAAWVIGWVLVGAYAAQRAARDAVSP